MCMGAEEMGQHLRELTAFVENLSSVPRNNDGCLTTICHSSSKGSDALCWSHKDLHPHAHSHIDKEFKIRTFTACLWLVIKDLSMSYFHPHSWRKFLLGIAFLSLRTSETICNCLLDAMVSGEKFIVSQTTTTLCVSHHLFATDLKAQQRRCLSIFL